VRIAEWYFEIEDRGAAKCSHQVGILPDTKKKQRLVRHQSLLQQYFRMLLSKNEGVKLYRFSNGEVSPDEGDGVVIGQCECSLQDSVGADSLSRLAG
jgi:hypothetical protein